MYDEDLLREVDGPDHKRKQVRRLLMHLQIRTEDFLDVATSARLSVVVPTCFHVPVRAIGYYCYDHFCYEAGLTGVTLGARAQVSMLPASI